MSILADVRDVDCIVSFTPLAFDLTTREVRGAAAVLRRVLYRWCTRKRALRYDAGVGLVRPLLDLDGASFDQAGLDGLRAALEREAADEDFVASARVPVRLVGSGALLVPGEIALVDGHTYPLEVFASQAQVALRGIGGTA